ncbi:unnamed protein product [Tilletia caries]|nr:unnamed protein product [Tilletia caries]
MSAESNTQSDSNRLPGVVTRSSQQSVTPRWAAGSTEGQDDEEAFARYDPSRTAIENKVALVTLQLDKQGFGRYQLCVWILAGFGYMLVDGTIVVETIPTQQRWMVALLSTFQPLGVVLCTLLAYAFIPSRTCGPEVAAGECTKSANFGWRTLMLVMGAITLCVFFARFFIFDFHETPQFLLSVGDDEGAIRVLKAIAKQNRKEDVMTLTVEDFQRVDALALGTDTVASVEGEIIRADRDSDGDDGKLKPGALGSESEQRKVDKTATPVNVAAPIRRLQAAAVTSKTTSALTVRQEKGFIAFALFHVKATFVRSIAGLLTLFGNKRLARDKGGETNHTIRETYASYIAIYAPGLTATLLAGALYSLNRRAQLLSLIFSSALMAVSLFLYAAVNSWESSIGLNALEYWAQSLFNAMLYAYTPITYPSSIRGTGSGTCSTVGRIASIVAPIAGKKLYGDGGPTNAQNTVYLAGAIALVTPLALALLPWETGKRVQAL